MQIPKLYANSKTKQKIDLTLSINPLGCSSLVLKKLRSLKMDSISNYPNTLKLQQTLADFFNVNINNLLLGCGSEQLIKLISQVLINKGDEAIVEPGSFGVFTKELLISGARVKMKFIKDMKLRKNLRLVMIANPKTPTGEIEKPEVIVNLAKTLFPAIVVVDEANGEFSSTTQIPKAIKSQNLIVLRTFSKAFGLAGLRIGAAIGPNNIIQKLAQQQQPFPVSQITADLTSVALKDKKFIEKTINFIAKERTFLISELTKRKFIVSNSVTNNLFIQTQKVAEIIEMLQIQDVSVINGKFFPGMQTEGFRISIKDRKTNKQFLEKLDQVLQKLNHHHKQN